MTEGRRAHDELGFRRHGLETGRPRRLSRRQQRAGGERAVFDDTLADRREPDDLGDLVVVDAHERDVARDVEAELARRDAPRRTPSRRRGRRSPSAGRRGSSSSAAWWPPSTVNSPLRDRAQGRAATPAAARAGSTPRRCAGRARRSRPAPRPARRGCRCAGARGRRGARRRLARCATLSMRTDGTRRSSWPMVTTPSRRRPEVDDSSFVERRPRRRSARRPGGRGRSPWRRPCGAPPAFGAVSDEQVVAVLGAHRLGAGDDVGEVPRVDQRHDDGDRAGCGRPPAATPPGRPGS